MASVFKSDAVNIANKDGNSGYVSNGHYNKYAEELDKVDFFTGCGKKNGSEDHCAIAYCDWIYEACHSDNGKPLTDDERKYLTHYVIYQSDSCCTAAGCTQQAQVYKDHNAWYENPKYLQTGDQIFFKKSNAKNTYYHTGMCTDWNAEGAFVTEANVEGGKTKIRFYPYSEFGKKIGGFGRPRWDAEPTQKEVKPELVKVNDGSEYTEAEIKAAYDCYEGYYGNGMTRKNNLIQAGFSYERVQGLVNKIVHGEFKR